MDNAEKLAREAWCLGSTMMEQHILHLHIEHDMGYEAIAERTGMSAEVVEAACNRHERVPVPA